MTEVRAPSRRRAVWSWAFIDWANSAFTLVVITTFFPLLTREYWTNDVSSERSTLYLGLANTLSGLVLAVVAPVLGAIADQGGGKKRFLVFFTFLGCVSTLLLPLVAEGRFGLAALLYGIAAVGFSGNSMFSDALLSDVAEAKQYHRVSALAFGLGYLGSGALLVFCAYVFQHPVRFGLGGGVEAARCALLLTAAWWLLFTVPALLWVRERPARFLAPSPRTPVLTRGSRQLITTFHEIRADRRTFFFLCGYVLYIDGVNSVVRMAADFGSAIGIAPATLLSAILVTQFVGVPASIVFGRLAERMGALRGIVGGIIVYFGVCLYGATITTGAEFMLLAATIGLVQGGVQSLSRSYFAQLIPSGKESEYFGFYNIIGKSATILGPTMVGVSAMLVGTRLAILSLLLLFGGGLWLLSSIRPARRLYSMS